MSLDPADHWPLTCHRCSALLSGDPDDEPTGGIDGQPLCGDCARSRDEAADVEALDSEDGALDGNIDL